MQHHGHALFQKLANRQRVFRLPHRAQFQSLQTLMHHPRVEWRQIRSGVALERQQHLIDPFLRSADRAGQNAPLSVHQFCRAVGNDIGTVIHRTLQHAGCKGVIDDRCDPVLLRQPADIGHIDDIHCRVGGRFEEKDLGIGLDSRKPFVIIAAVDNRGGNSPTRQQLVGQPAARSERRPRRNHVIALAKLA